MAMKIGYFLYQSNFLDGFEVGETIDIIATAFDLALRFMLVTPANLQHFHRQLVAFGVKKAERTPKKASMLRSIQSLLVDIHDIIL